MMEEETRILVIDDDESTRKMLSLIFEKKGYSCSMVGSGAEAIQAARDVHFNIALIDIRLPDMSGIELLSTLCNDYPEMDSIIITGFASIDNAIQALNQGASAYITKPVEMDTVLHEVERIIEKHRLIAEKRMANDRIEHLKGFHNFTGA